MDWVGFGLLLSDHLLLYSGLLLASFSFYALLFKRFYISALDPAMFAVLFSVFGFSVVWFLYFTGSIATYYLLSYLFTQIAFWLGLFTFRSLSRTELLSLPSIVVFEDELLFEKVFFIAGSAIYIFVQLLSYQVIGIPLLLGTHIDVYNNSGGWGILGRILDVIKPCVLFLLVYFLFRRSHTAWFGVFKYIVLFSTLIFFALSGSKGEFMSLGFIVFCFLILNAGRMKSYFSKLRLLEALILSAGLLFVFFTILAQPADNGITGNSVEFFLFRLVSSGDTYFFAYPNQNVEHISGAHPFLALFGDLLSTIRVVPREDQPQILGLQLFRMFSNLDIITGPNARHNVFGYFYFGFFGSILFSFLLGLLLSFVRNRLFFPLRRNLLGQLLFVLLYLNVAGIETDPPQAVSGLENVLLILPAVLAVVLFFFLLLRKVPRTPELATEIR